MATGKKFDTCQVGGAIFAAQSDINSDTLGSKTAVSSVFAALAQAAIFADIGPMPLTLPLGLPQA